MRPRPPSYRSHSAFHSGHVRLLRPAAPRGGPEAHAPPRFRNWPGWAAAWAQPALGGLTVLGHVRDGHAVLLGHVPQEGEDHEAGGEARQGVDRGGDDGISGRRHRAHAGVPLCPGTPAPPAAPRVGTGPAAGTSRLGVWAQPPGSGSGHIPTMAKRLQGHTTQCRRCDSSHQQRGGSGWAESMALGGPAHAGSGWWGGDLVRMQVLWEAGQMVPFPAAPGGRSCWSQTPLRAGQSRAAPAEGRPGVPRPGVQRGCAGLCQDMLWDPGRSPSGHFAARMLYFYCFSFSGCENVNDLRRSGRAGRRSKSAPVSSRALGSAGSGGSPRAFWAGRHSRAAVSAGGRRCHVLACLGPRHRGASAQRLGQPPDPGSVDSWVLPQGGQGRG